MISLSNSVPYVCACADFAAWTGVPTENRELQQRVEHLQSAGPGVTARRTSTLDVAAETADLQARVTQQDATIKALQAQLARLQGGQPGAPALSTSQSVPVVKR